MTTMPTQKLSTGRVILSFPHLFEAKAAQPGGDPRFSCVFIFNKPALGTPEFLALRKAVAEAIDDKWGAGKSKDMNFVRGLRSPFRKCSEKQYKGYEDPQGVFISAWTKDPPNVRDRQNQVILKANEVWPGQMVIGNLNAFAYQNSGNKGVSFSLNGIQVVRTDTPRLDSRANPETMFPVLDEDPDGYGAALDHVNGAPPGSDDDDIPF